MTEQIPIVSIIMPTYNRAKTLRRAIDSIFKQTFTAWEFIVIDDTSTDGTAEILAEFSARDSRIKVIRNATSTYAQSGITGPLNQGLAAARGKYIARLDDDDYWILPDKLEKQVAYLDSHPDCVVIGGGVIVIDENEKERYRYLKNEGDPEIRKSALLANPFSHTTVMFRADIARAVGNYRAHYAEDWDMWLSMGMHGKFHNLQEYVTAYQLTGGNKSFIHQRAQSKEILFFVTAHRKEYPNFFKAYFLNEGQYLFSFFPVWFRESLHGFLTTIKRKM